ncbi:RDD family protein [Streptomyces sp. TRM66268-LWL]|uniref:RDD family protein n=1 Tax=Streptomyces polyasparticus TaxID=2767826 RepID=A0ABR7SNV8_9ACTN|nr:RDD family protein [Streptomyces polyasparticus]MBC9716657.1 RDD family protein [Streptomyces polyasparticus]
MSELVTGEAVALELRAARLPSRALAVMIDLAAAFAAYIAVSLLLLAAAGSLDGAAQAAISVATFILVLVGAPIAVETLSHGRSLGKLACGLRVVRDDGGPIRFRHALVRGAMGVIEILGTAGVVACIASLVSARGRRLGDVFAGTLVVRERIPVARTAYVPPPPPWLVGRFAELDLSGVPDALWLAIRQYLTRMGQLDPQVGWSMAARLANDLAACTGSAAPQEVPPAAYLAAVVQERQARDARKAFGAAPVPGYGAPAYGTPGNGAPAYGTPGYGAVAPAPPQATRPASADASGPASAQYPAPTVESPVSAPGSGAFAPPAGQPASQPVQPSYRSPAAEPPAVAQEDVAPKTGFAPPA